MLPKNSIVHNFVTPETNSAMIYKCIVNSVRPDTMSADIYIPQTATTYQGAYIGEGVCSLRARSGGMPEVGAEALVALYSKTGRPTIIAFLPPASFNKDDLKLESALSGEYQIISSGNSSVKCDRLGNVLLQSKGAEKEVISDGLTLSYLRSKKDISNLFKKELITEVGNDIISLGGNIELHEKCDVSIYSKEDFLSDESLCDKLLDELERFNSDLFSGFGMFNYLESLLDAAVTLKDYEVDLKLYADLIKGLKISCTGNSLKIGVFGEGGFKIELVSDNGETLSGISINANGTSIINEV